MPCRGCYLPAGVIERDAETAVDFGENVRRIGFVASEITEPGAFIEIHVATPPEVCEARDRKGLYEKARKRSSPFANDAQFNVAWMKRSGIRGVCRARTPAGQARPYRCSTTPPPASPAGAPP